MANPSNKSKLRQILLLATLSIGFIAFAVMPLISIIKPSPESSVPPEAAVKNEEIMKNLKEQEQVYQKILEREPKNQTALQGVIDARIKMFKVTGDLEILSKTLTPLDELIKQNPKNETLQALKNQIKLTVNTEQPKPTPTTKTK